MSFKVKYLESKKIAISCRDLGSANLIYNFIKYNKKKNIYYYAQGPAKKIFKKLKIKNYATEVTSNENLLLNADLFIGGSGFSNFEKKSLLKAKKKKIPSYSILDNFTFYPKRFLAKKKLSLPENFITFDLEAYKLAKKFFKKKKIHLVKNYYLYDFRKRLKLKSVDSNILYISEPFNEGYEVDSLKFLLNKLDNINLHISSKIFIKTHPKDNIKKYTKIIDQFKHKFNIILNNELDGVKLFNKCKLVFGISSYLLLMAARLGKKTYHCKLPNQKNIKLLNNKKIMSFYKMKLRKKII